MGYFSGGPGIRHHVCLVVAVNFAASNAREIVEKMKGLRRHHFLKKK